MKKSLQSSVWQRPTRICFKLRAQFVSGSARQTELKLRIQWYKRLTNREVLERAGIEPISAFVGNGRLRWFGHVVRMPEERVPNRLYHWAPIHGKRSRGRPRTAWPSCVLNDFRDATGRSQSLRAITNIATDRKEWRRLTSLRVRIPEAGHSND